MIHKRTHSAICSPPESRHNGQSENVEP